MFPDLISDAFAMIILDYFEVRRYLHFIKFPKKTVDTGSLNFQIVNPIYNLQCLTDDYKNHIPALDLNK